MNRLLTSTLVRRRLVVRLGSTMPFSLELKRLREEVRPLSRLPSCPRDYKRTTVERLFRDAGLTLDWCSFELVGIFAFRFHIFRLIQD